MLLPLTQCEVWRYNNIQLLFTAVACLPLGGLQKSDAGKSYGLWPNQGPFHQIHSHCNPLSPHSICRGTLSLPGAKVDKMTESINPLKARWESPHPLSRYWVTGQNEWGVVYVVSAASLSPLDKPLSLWRWDEKWYHLSIWQRCFFDKFIFVYWTHSPHFILTIF